MYAAADEERVRRMLAALADGLAASEAARAALGPPEDAPVPDLVAAVAELRDAVARFDDAAVHARLDRLLAAYTLETVVSRVLFPLLRALGEGWERGEVTVAQEHFASNVLRGRLLALARGWNTGAGRPVVLACAPGERHDLALVVLAVALRERGRRVLFLGADTPVSSLPADDGAVVVSAADPARFAGAEPDLRALASSARLYVAGPGASEELAARLGASALPSDPFAAAAAIAG
jgi:methanogenic corrinoid protein MtbC1